MKFSEKYDIGALARRLRQEVQGTNPVTLRGFGAWHIQSVLESSVDFHPAVALADRPGIIWDAMLAFSGGAAHEGEDLKAALKKEETAYLRRPLRSFVMVTSVNLPKSTAPLTVRLDGVRVQLSPSLHSFYSRAPLDEETARVTRIEHPDALMPVRVGTSARTDKAAFDLALERLDFFRAGINYAHNRRTEARLTAGPFHPVVNELRLGPIHSLHTTAGALASDLFWCEPLEQQTERFAVLNGNWSAYLGATRGLRRRIQRHQYGAAIRAQLVRYVRALDLPDYVKAFNELWAVLEHLTDSVGDYTKLVKRVTFRFTSKEKDFVCLVMEHLRDVRNGIVHYGRIHNQMERVLWQLIRFVHGLMDYHLAGDNSFPTMSAAAGFLDHPQDVELIRSRIKLLRRALRFRQVAP